MKSMFATFVGVTAFAINKPCLKDVLDQSTFTIIAGVSAHAYSHFLKKALKQSKFTMIIGVTTYDINASQIEVCP